MIEGKCGWITGGGAGGGGGKGCVIDLLVHLQLLSPSRFVEPLSFSISAPLSVPRGCVYVFILCIYYL